MAGAAAAGGHDARPRLDFALGTLSTADLFAADDFARLQARCRTNMDAPLRRLDGPSARDRLANTDILVTGWGCPPIGAAVLDAAPSLRLIAHAAGSVKAWALRDILARGVAVVTAADANALPVAEFTLATILGANKRIGDYAALYRRERRGLELSLNAPAAVGNWHKTIGIVGASRIGRRVIELLRPFDLSVLLFDPFVEAASAAVLGAEKVELDVLLRRSDVVSLHAPSLPETRHLIDGRGLALMRDGAILINTARGALIEQSALERELVAGRLWAAIDVTEPEVLPADSPLYDLPNVVLTPHIAGALGNERLRFGRLVTDEVERFVSGEALRHAVDPLTIDRQA
jgi:phosphoglycerate dehydrogenase-like enzyme